MQKLQLEIVRGCFLDCRWCPVDKENYSFMPLEFVENVCEQIVKNKVGRDVLRLIGRGEPLLYPDWKKLLRLLHDKNINKLSYIDIYTNGMLMNEKMARFIIESDVINEVVFSVDGFGTKESYEYCRSKAKWETIIENVNFFNSLALKKQGKTFCRLEVIVPQTGSVPAEMEKDRPYVDENFKKNFPGVNFCKREIHRYDGAIEKEGMPEYQGKKGMCALIHRHWMVINWDGTVSPCCLDAQGTSIVGDLNKNSIVSVWNSKKYRKLRYMLFTGRHREVEYCKNCENVITDKKKMLSRKRWWLYDDYLVKYLGLSHRPKVGW